MTANYGQMKANAWSVTNEVATVVAGRITFTKGGAHKHFVDSLDIHASMMHV